MTTRILDISPATYQRHALHAEGERHWIDKNCYVDVFIELIHALGCEPAAMLGFCAGIDFVGESWTFYKPSHDEMRLLYGVEVNELNVWKTILEQGQFHLSEGRFVQTEADAFYLPDAAGTDYRRNHVKTSIVFNSIDLEGRRLGYFHNAGYHELEGDDFAHVFNDGIPRREDFLPFFAETVRIDRLVRRPPDELRQLSRGLLRHHLAQLPAPNPVRRFGERFEAELAAVRERGLAFYHAWAFANLRQLGSAMELLGFHLRWLGDEKLAEPFERISTTCKAFILKGARAVNGKKPLDARPMFDEMTADWAIGMEALGARAS